VIADRVAISGVGRTPARREPAGSLVAVVADAIVAAAGDAGIDVADIDGLSGYPGGSPSIHDLREALELRLRWFDAGSEGSAHLRSLVAAIHAVAAGAATHVAVFRGVDRLPGSWAAAPPGGIRAELDLLNRLGISDAVPLFALRAARLCHELDVGRQELATIAIAAHRAAAANPDALIRDGLTRDEYMAAPMLATPLTRHDCDRLCSGAVAVIVSAADAVTHVDRAVVVESMAAPLRDSGSLLHAPRPAMWDCAHDLWAASRRRPGDIGVWCVYDGFSSLALEWLAALGVGAPAELPGLLADPAALAPDGPLPVNPDGGMLAGGRLHGLNYVHEACLQLRGDGGPRQVRPHPEAAVVAVGGGPIAAAAILTRHDPPTRSCR
jgi:acetyl-CoA acetyltransferase